MRPNLQGNLISAERLTRLLTDYLREQGFSEPREKAHRLIQQLRERNFILCYRGADTYGFVHRTFLEYFCAVEIVHRFEKQQTLSFEQLRDEVFGQHWQDETWHEVLLLICGMTDAKFVGELVEYLLSNANCKTVNGFENIFMASECIAEISNKLAIKKVSSHVLAQIKTLVEYGENSEIDEVYGFWGNLRYGSYHKLINVPEKLHTIIFVRYSAIELVAKVWQDEELTLEWIKKQANSQANWVAVCSAIQQLSKRWKNDPETFCIIKKLSCLDVNSAFSNVQETALVIISECWPDHPDTLSILKSVSVRNKNFRGRFQALQGFRKLSLNSLSEGLFEFLADRAKKDPFEPYHFSNRNPRQSAIETIVECYPDHLHTRDLLIKIAVEDRDSRVRSFILSILPVYWEEDTLLIDFLCNRALSDPYENGGLRRRNPRKYALESLLNHYPKHPKTLEILGERAVNDPDEQLRKWAQEQLNIQTEKSKREGQS